MMSVVIVIALVILMITCVYADRLVFVPGFTAPNSQSHSELIAAATTAGDATTAGALLLQLGMYNVPSGDYVLNAYKVELQYDNGTTMMNTDGLQVMARSVDTRIIAGSATSDGYPGCFGQWLLVIPGPENIVPMKYFVRTNCINGNKGDVFQPIIDGVASFDYLSHTLPTPEVTASDPAISSRHLVFTVVGRDDIDPLIGNSFHATFPAAKAIINPATPLPTEIIANTPFPDFQVMILFKNPLYSPLYSPPSPLSTPYIPLADGIDANLYVDITIPFTLDGRVLSTFIEVRNTFLQTSSKVRMAGGTTFVDSKGTDRCRVVAVGGYASFSGLRVLDIYKGLRFNITMSKPHPFWSRVPMGNFERDDETVQKSIAENNIALTSAFDVLHQTATNIRIVEGTDASSIDANFPFETLPLIEIVDVNNSRIYSGPDSELLISVSVEDTDLEDTDICLTGSSMMAVRGLGTFDNSVCQPGTNYRLVFTTTSSVSGEVLSISSTIFNVSDRVNFGVLYPGTGAVGFLGSELGHISKIALNDHNNDTGLFSGVLRSRTLNLAVLEDTQSNSVLGTSHILNSVGKGREPKIRAFIGPGAKEVSFIASQLLSSAVVPSIGYLSSDARLSQKNIYPWLSRVSRPDTTSAIALAKMIAARGWTHIVLVVSVDDTMSGEFAFWASRLGITIDMEVSIPVASTNEDITNSMISLRESNSFVIVTTISNPKVLANLLSYAAAEGISCSQGYQWVGGPDVWRAFPFLNQHSPCDSINCVKLYKGFIFMKEIYGDVSGEDSSLWSDLFNKHAVASGNTAISAAAIPYMGLIYDSIVVLAKALHHLVEAKSLISHISLVNAIRSVSMSGFSGYFSLDPITGDRIGWEGELVSLHSRVDDISPASYDDVAESVSYMNIDDVSSPIYEKILKTPTYASGAPLQSRNVLTKNAAGETSVINSTVRVPFSCKHTCGGGLAKSSKFWLPGACNDYFWSVEMKAILANLINSKSNNLTHITDSCGAKGEMADSSRCYRAAFDDLTTDIRGLITLSRNELVTDELIAEQVVIQLVAAMEPLILLTDETFIGICGPQGQFISQKECKDMIIPLTAIGQNCGMEIAEPGGAHSEGCRAYMLQFTSVSQECGVATTVHHRDCQRLLRQYLPDAINRLLDVVMVPGAIESDSFSIVPSLFKNASAAASSLYLPLALVCGPMGEAVWDEPCTMIASTYCSRSSPSANYQNGICIEEGICKCDRKSHDYSQFGWSSEDCSVPRCSFSCNSGICWRPDICLCDFGWKGKQCDNTICVPECTKNQGACSAALYSTSGNITSLADNGCRCFSGFWHGEGGLACAETCDCNEEHSLRGTDNRFSCASDTGQCGCKEGYAGRQCDKKLLTLGTKLGLGLGLTAFVVIVTYILVRWFLRRLNERNELANLDWKIDWSTVKVIEQKNAFGSRVSARSGISGKKSMMSGISGQTRDQVFYQNLAVINGVKCAIKFVYKPTVPVTLDLRMEMKAVRSARHQNIVMTAGACLDEPNVCILLEYCAKGSLSDVLGNQEVNLDWAFRYSIARDIAAGMEFLHKSEVGAHGRLKSSNCLIDGRWVVKISDFGLHGFKNGQDEEKLEVSDFGHYTSLFWTAPELLRENEPDEWTLNTNRLFLLGTKLGDIYSFGVILSEMVTREPPFSSEQLEPSDIIKKVKKVSDVPFRPSIEGFQYSNNFKSFMMMCLEEDPLKRFHSFGAVVSHIKKLSPKSGNLVDNMVKMLEKYSANLELLVEERTLELEDAKARSEELLYRLLPEEVANALQTGGTVPAKTYDGCSIFFSDIVGFTKISAASTPLQVVALLNLLYTTFDTTIDLYDAYKVETIGDAYMVVSGIPKVNGDRHACEIANVCLDLLADCADIIIPHLPDEQLFLRIGMHSGPAVAGVVGLKMPRYCLFGETVSIASSMESGGMALKVHISVHTYNILIKSKYGYITELRTGNEEANVGFDTYFLWGRKDWDRRLPDRSKVPEGK